MPVIKVSGSAATPILNPDPLFVPPNEVTAVLWVKDPPNAPFMFTDIKIPKKQFPVQEVTNNAIVALYAGEPAKPEWKYTVTVQSTAPGSAMFGDGSGTIRNH